MKIEKIVVGELYENCYILIKGKDCLVIDPGAEGNKIINFINKNNLKVLGILITHAHFDHIGALDDLIKEYDVDIYYYNINGELKSNIIDTFEDNININAFKFKTIYTPGHRNDSLTFYFYEENIMFTGDFLFYGTIGRTDLKYGNMDEMKTSIQKIKAYNDDIKIYPGHRETTHLGHEKQYNYFFLIF